MSSKHASSPVTFALIGCGNIAPTQAKALQALAPAAQLVACCDEVPERAEQFANEYGIAVSTWPEILADPQIEAVTLCTPSGLHAKLAIEGLAAGKHVILEKPMDVTADACDAILQAQARSGRQLGVISQHRFDPASQHVRSEIDAGCLGKLILVEARVPWFRKQEYYDSGAWRGTWALDGGGCLMNQGIHTVDLMLWLCGPVESVSAQMRTAAHENIEVEDMVVATLSFANGAIGTLMASTSCYPGFPANLAIYGTEGSAVIEGDNLKTLAIRGRETLSGNAATAHAMQVATGGTRSATEHAVEPVIEAWKWGDAHRAQFADFIEAVRAGGKPLVDGHEGRKAVSLIRAVYQSAQSGKPVRPE
jgi:UDP-N-acetyl-2-amino-2-deoxyglucuronate dehydrogenase